MMIRSRLESDPKGTKWRDDFDSQSSQGDTQPYHASGDAALAMTGKELSLYIVSQSKTIQSSSGKATGVAVPSLVYLVQPLLRSHFLGASGRVISANIVAMERYGSAASFPII